MLFKPVKPSSSGSEHSFTFCVGKKVGDNGFICIWKVQGPRVSMRISPRRSESTTAARLGFTTSTTTTMQTDITSSIATLYSSDHLLSIGYHNYIPRAHPSPLSTLIMI